MRLLLLLCLVITMVCCNSKDSSTTKVPDPAQPTTAPAQPATPDPATAVSYPSISLEEMQELVGKTTLIDYVFYELPISLNLDNEGAIQQALRQISDKPAQIFPECKAMGRVIFQSDGDIMKEADFYFQNPCYGFVFIENNKPTKSNMMTQEGANFFSNILSNAASQRPNQ